MAGRYRLLEPLGRGGMGEVWRGVDDVLVRPVAVKLLLGRQGDEAAMARFRLEARTAAQLNSPHVVAVYDAGVEQDRPYLVTELLGGRSLAAEIAADGPFAPRRAAEAGRHVAAGLAAAHRQGVIHRDVKPANLLLATDGTVKIADFGIARFADEGTGSVTTAGQILGTGAYLSPERCLGRPAGPPADVYALGCVLYELLTGRPPFNADTAAGVVYQHVDVMAEPPGRHRSGIPEALDAFVLRLLAKRPEERPTAEEAMAFLGTPQACGIRREPAGKREAFLPAATAATAATAGSPPGSEREEGTREKRGAPLRKPRLLAGLAVAVLSSAAVLGLSATAFGPGNAPPSGRAHSPVAGNTSPSAVSAGPHRTAADGPPVPGRSARTASSRTAAHGKKHSAGDRGRVRTASPSPSADRTTSTAPSPSPSPTSTSSPSPSPSSSSATPTPPHHGHTPPGGPTPSTDPGTPTTTTP
ncbi:serine/threonine-protein kinase [Streptomyces sulfonofaciens]|uniref:serine/threonine-protein kinase n=1 Tax=Streptomyces sulfonofaciens TaxID=68272 RepID=UPI001E49FBE5|nr:serine/threonine-protein kinase [Streptomyces sulfonofaciens]